MEILFHTNIPGCCPGIFIIFMIWSPAKALKKEPPETRKTFSCSLSLDPLHLQIKMYACKTSKSFFSSFFPFPMRSSPQFFSLSDYKSLIDDRVIKSDVLSEWQVVVTGDHRFVKRKLFSSCLSSSLEQYA